MRVATTPLSNFTANFSFSCIHPGLSVDRGARQHPAEIRLAKGVVIAAGFLLSENQIIR